MDKSFEERIYKRKVHKGEECMTRKEDTMRMTEFAGAKFAGADYGGKDERHLPRNIDLEELFNYWKMTVRYQVKPSTFACYCTIIQKHILPELGKILLPELDNEMLIKFIRKLQQRELSGNTVRLIMFLIKSMIKTGEEIGCVTAESLRYCMPRARNATTRLMSEEHFRMLLQRLLRARNDFETGLLISLCTGIRVGELCGLKWGDVDFNAGCLQIQRTVSRIQNMEALSEKKISAAKTTLFIGTPKTGTSARDIPLPDFLLSRLRERRHEASFFLLTGTERCMEPRGVQRRFKNLLKKQGIPYVNIHSLRHSFASNWIESGFDTKALSEILGHSSVKITMDIYVHSSMNQKKDYMNRLLSV